MVLARERAKTTAAIRLAAGAYVGRKTWPLPIYALAYASGYVGKNAKAQMTRNHARYCGRFAVLKLLALSLYHPSALPTMTDFVPFVQIAAQLVLPNKAQWQGLVM